MRGSLQQLLASGKPIICLSLNPPLFPATAESISTCQKCKASGCACSAEAALLKALEAAFKTESIGAVKLDTAYYEQFGPSGFKLLDKILDLLPPSAAVIIDGKRGDISNTAAAYSRAFFDYYRADAVTVSSYMGRDAVCPFLSHADAACVFVDCRPASATSLASLKGIPPSSATSPLALYEHVAYLCQDVSASHSGKGVLGLLAAAQEPAEAQVVWQLRKSFPTVPFLLDLHCDVSEFFSELANHGESSPASSNLLICFNPPSLEDAAECIQKARKQLHVVYPEIFTA